MKKRALLQSGLCMVLAGGMLFSGCAADGTGQSMGGEEQVMSESERFDAYLDDMFREEIVLNTINLHYTLAYPEDYGITDYEVDLGSFSQETIAESYQELHKIEQELREFRKDDLTEEQRLTYDILKDYVETELAVEDLSLYTEYLNPTSGYQNQLPILLAEYTFRTRQDIEDYLALVTQVDDVLADIAAFEEQKAEAGLFMPDYAVDAVIDQCEQFIADPENNYMIDVFNDKIAVFEGLSQEERQDYIDQNTTLITTEVVDGFEMLAERLRGLRGSGTNEYGLYYYEDGKEYYEYLVRTETGSDDSVEELMERTDRFIQTAINQMRILFNENPGLFDAITDYAFPVTEPDAIMEDLISKVESDFPEPPETAYTIKYVHPSLQEYMSPAFYLVTPVDDSINNVIYINEKYLGEDGWMDLYPTMAHEGYPGHLYQNCYTNSCGLPLIRNMFSFSGYTEGWATYVESYSYGVSGIEPSLAKLLSINEAMTLGIHAYIDMGVNYKGWKYEDVANYLNSYGYDGDAAAEDMLQVMVGDPGNYLNYFIGYLEIRDLRDQAKKALGDDFVLKDFHQFLLEIGPAPFYIIEDYMEAWVETR